MGSLLLSRGEEETVGRGEGVGVGGKGGEECT
jgi:hypothetical protein